MESFPSRGFTGCSIPIPSTILALVPPSHGVATNCFPSVKEYNWPIAGSSRIDFMPPKYSRIRCDLDASSIVQVCSTSFQTCFPLQSLSDIRQTSTSHLNLGQRRMHRLLGRPIDWRIELLPSGRELSIVLVEQDFQFHLHCTTFQFVATLSPHEGNMVPAIFR